MKFRLSLVLLMLGLLGCDAGQPSDGLQLRVMTFNTWGAGANEAEPVDATVAAIRAANPDIVGLQEMRAEADVCSGDDCAASGPSAAPAIARALGYHYVEQTAQNDALWANAIFSRYPIVATTDNALGAVFDIDGRRVALFNVHFTDYPYQPYQLLGIPYDEAPFFDNEAAAIAAAEAARGDASGLLLREIDSLADVAAIFVTGDFNEPSHRDWTARAAHLGRHPLAVAFPTVRRLEAAGFRDAYREKYPDEMAHPGYTWTPTTAADDQNDHHDRIDFVMLRADGATVVDAAVVGEASPASDIAVEPWPSDHRGVVVTVTLP